MVLKRLTDVRTSRHNPNGAEAADRRAHFAAQPQWRCRQRPQRFTLFKPAGLPSQVALLDQVLQEAVVRGTLRKIAAPAGAQRLVDGALELTVLLFDVAVLMGNAEVVGGRLQTVMHHQQAVALLGPRTFIRIQRVDRGAEVIGAMLAGNAANDLPHARLEAFDQRLEAFREADPDRLDIRVHQHQVVDQVRERHAAQRHVQAIHVGEVRLRGFPRFMQLRKHHLALGTVLGTPGSDVPLQRPQLPVLVAARMPFTQ
jgi:hypothetical protein